MKIIAFLLVVFILYTGCAPFAGVDEGSPVTDVEPSDIIPEPQSSDVAEPEKELPYAFILSPDFDRSEGITSVNYAKLNVARCPVAFDFGELAWDVYPSGEWSVDELVEKYGEPITNVGSDAIRGGLSRGKTGVSVIWWPDNKRDMYVHMETKRDGEFSFDILTNSEHELYPLTVEDRAIKIQIHKIGVSGEDLPLPRGLKVGQSTIEDIRAAYPVEGTDVDGYHVTHQYVWFDEIAIKEEIEKPDMGYIKYSCDANGVLYGVEIVLPSELRI